MGRGPWTYFSTFRSKNRPNNRSALFGSWSLDLFRLLYRDKKQEKIKTTQLGQDFFCLFLLFTVLQPGGRVMRYDFDKKYSSAPLFMSESGPLHHRHIPAGRPAPVHPTPVHGSGLGTPTVRSADCTAPSKSKQGRSVCSEVRLTPETTSPVSASAGRSRHGGACRFSRSPIGWDLAPAPPLAPLFSSVVRSVTREGSGWCFQKCCCCC